MKVFIPFFIILLNFTSPKNEFIQRHRHLYTFSEFNSLQYGELSRVKARMKWYLIESPNSIHFKLVNLENFDEVIFTVKEIKSKDQNIYHYFCKDGISISIYLDPIKDVSVMVTYLDDSESAMLFYKRNIIKVGNH